MRNRYRLLLICCLLMLMGCSPSVSGKKVTVEVQRVVSGQTIDVLMPDTSPLIQRVRLIGIDAPDLQQDPWGQAAKETLEQLLSQDDRGLVLDSVQLEFGAQEEDSYGRRLAYVWHDGMLINEQLVKRGAALADARSRNSQYSQRLNRAQDYARIMGYGIWNPQQPLRVPPAEFRSQQ